MIFIRCPLFTSLKCIDFDIADVTVDQLVSKVSHKTNIPKNLLIPHDGCKQLSQESTVPSGSTVYFTFSLPGGKGGFGSMLRAIGAQIEKTTNREACRDLSGRRLRDINEEQRLKKWLAKKVEREKETEQRRKERLQRLKEQPKHEFHDPEYNKMRSELSERIDEALSEGLKKGKSVGGKKPLEDKAGPSAKKPCLWLEEDIPSDTSSDFDDDTDSKEKSIDSDEQSNDKESFSVEDSSSDALSSKDAQCKESTTILSDECDTNNGLDHQEDSSMPSVNSSTEKEIDKESAPPNNEKSTNKEEKPTEDTHADISTEDLLSFKDVEELEQLGLEKLKEVLKNFGLKCGGTLRERAQRIWSIRGLDPKDFPASLKAKVVKKPAK